MARCGSGKRTRARLPARASTNARAPGCWWRGLTVTSIVLWPRISFAAPSCRENASRLQSLSMCQTQFETSNSLRSKSSGSDDDAICCRVEFEHVKWTRLTAQVQPFALANREIVDAGMLAQH